MKRTYLFIPAIFILLQTLIVGQGFSNIKVNHLREGDQNTDGGNSIAIGGNNIYLLWADFNSSYFSYVSKSTDNGLSFATGVRTGGKDPHVFGAIAADDNGSVYVAWNGIAGEDINGVYFAKSTDQANSFSNPITVSDFGAFPQIAVSGNNVYLFFIKSTAGGKIGCFFARSLNGGSTFETPYEISSGETTELKFDSPCSMVLDKSGNIYCAWNDGRRDGTGTDIYVAKSTNAGASFGQNVMVNDASGSANKIRTGPSLAADGMHVYMTWRQEDDEQGSNRKILFSKSIDGGASFSSATEIAQGGWGSPALTINGSGDIYLAYPQYSTEQNGLFCTKSIDHGNTFPVTVFINSVNANAKNISISVDANDILHAVWTDNRSGSDGVYYAKGEITITNIDETFLFPTDFELSQNYPNPFNPSTTIRFALPQSGNFTLKVYNMLGQEVATLIDGSMNAGTHNVSFNANGLASGLYIYRLAGDNVNITKKMILMK